VMITEAGYTALRSLSRLPESRDEEKGRVGRCTPESTPISLVWLDNAPQRAEELKTY
jgi:hypothetical protein